MERQTARGSGPHHPAFNPSRPEADPRYPGELWKEIEGYDGEYQVSNYGRVVSYRTRTRWFYGISNKPSFLKFDISYGHYRVTLSRARKTKRFLVSRLVLLAFGPKPANPKLFALHCDDNPTNNHVSNLRWGTYSDNEINKRKKMSKQGVNGPGAKLTLKDVQYILKTYKRNIVTYKMIAKKLGVNHQTVRRAVHPNSWMMKQYKLVYG